ncbi:3-oxoacyl-ACP reductase FabG [Anaplasma capra]|uniref:3-oxoacyl-ACP reductase FabG n=1 Tax=Anaplasma capra TaxID=1562740 RepID=UPI0021D5F409|nr:3-oxoacyl-ACP reductase FabG [Anaplasma capra]MCU7611663.1 3-oxoacyl-ACP reductase FabG [Anaplasma capra]MCU7612188.1 3-oxoacyl-ACP reductase FabG [Anaplasma capra]
MFNLSGKKFLVVGASGGIGAAISVFLSKADAKLCISGTRMDALHDVASKCATSATHVLQCNLLNGEEVDTLVDRAAESMSGIDGVVCSAGITLDKLSLRITDEDWDKVIAVNLTSVFKINRGACRAMLKNKGGGRIINISSVVGVTGNVGQANYSASKSGIIGMSKSIALEFASRGITVNCVAPGFIDTQMTAQLSDKQKESILGNIPMGRMGTPEDVASVVLFLASNASSYITGQTIHVNGGMVMC